MYGLENILNSDALFVYFLSFIILVTILYDLLQRLNFFNSRYVSITVALIISFYVFLTNGYRIINFILSLSTIGIIILFGILILVIIVFRFWKRAKYEATGYF
ncbi:MAG: hypothetical protein KQA41_02170 [Candidatus Aenigmarchaeota archaeon]|nr:hypothetical protein [Candidatus Aenigmarchaeota archaeon]MBU5689007.1 hypothetical protein [Candidatus Aenigmarchaeota archaeon]